MVVEEDDEGWKKRGGQKWGGETDYIVVRMPPIASGTMGNARQTVNGVSYECPRLPSSSESRSRSVCPRHATTDDAQWVSSRHPT